MDNLSTVMPDQPVNATLTTRMHGLLEEAIITGELEPGQRLHADALAARYGMSRIPVREALRSLHEAGWVDIKPRHGVHVRERTRQELDELFEFRAVVEGRVARWAAERRTEDDLHVLAEVVEPPSPHVADLTVRRSSLAFYDALRRAAHNSVLQGTSAALEKRARFYYSTVLHQLGADWLHVHDRLVQHVVRQEADDACTLASRHVLDTGTAVRELLFPDG